MNYLARESCMSCCGPEGSSLPHAEGRTGRTCACALMWQFAVRMAVDMTRLPLGTPCASSTLCICLKGTQNVSQKAQHTAYAVMGSGDVATWYSVVHI